MMIMKIDLNKICRTLETKRCGVHNKNPTAIVVGEQIKVTSCCDKFQNELEKEMDIESSKQADKGIDDAIKGF